jgi:hypothetical protein
LIKRDKLDAKLVIKNSKPTGVLRDRLIRQGFDPDRFLQVDVPSFQLYYLSANTYEGRTPTAYDLSAKFCSVESYKVNEIIKYKHQIEYGGSNFVYDSEHDDVIRLYSICGGDDYKRWLREQKLKRILKK